MKYTDQGMHLDHSEALKWLAWFTKKQLDAGMEQEVVNSLKEVVTAFLASGKEYLAETKPKIILGGHHGR